VNDDVKKKHEENKEEKMRKERERERERRKRKKEHTVRSWTSAVVINARCTMN
jgi:hypothetical protein